MADTLDDLCPVCGEPIKDGEPWTIVDGEMVHERCDEGDERSSSTRTTKDR